MLSRFIIRENAQAVAKKCGTNSAKIKKYEQGEIPCKYPGNTLTRPEQVDRNKSSQENLNVYIEELRKCHIEKRDKLRKSAPKKQRSGNYGSFVQGSGEIEYNPRRQNTEINQHIPHPPIDVPRSTTPNHKILQFLDKNTPYKVGRAFILGKHNQKQSQPEIAPQGRVSKGLLNNSYTHINNEKEKDDLFNKSVMMSNIAHPPNIDNSNIKQQSSGFIKQKSAGISSKKSLNVSVLQESQSTDPTYSLQRNYATLEPEGVEDIHSGFVLYFQKQKRILYKMEKTQGSDVIF